MPITICCPACNKEYRVDDKLAGKKVKCRECGEPITVSPGESAKASTRVAEAPPTAPRQSGAIKRCPSCRSPMAATASYCAACGWSPTPPPTGGPTAAGYPVAGNVPVKPKRKWVRDPGNPTLNSIDSLINLLLWCGLIAGLVVWTVHIAKSPWGLSAVYLLPVAAAIAAIVGTAALMNVGIRAAARFLEFPPRDDTLNRALLILFLPFAASLLAGWPGLNNGLNSAVLSLSWIAAAALFIYFFRAEPIEWAASIGAGLTGLFLAYIIISQLAGPLGSVATLYRKMLPDGPWTMLATADLPAPEQPKPPPVAVATTQNTTPSTQSYADLFGMAGKTPLTQPSEANTQATSQPVVTPVAPRPPEEFPFLTDVTADKPEFQGVTDIRSGPANYAILAKLSDEGIATIERWTTEPLAHKGSTTVIESPVRPATFVLSPKADVLIACTHLPREQAQVLTFDSIKTTQTAPATDFPSAPPVALAFLSTGGGRVAIRTGTTLRFYSISPINDALVPAGIVTLPTEVINEPDGIVASPDGKYLAVATNDHSGLQIVIYDPLSTALGKVFRRIRATNAPVEKVIGLAYSPDSKQIAACVVMQQLTTLLPFNSSTGAPLPNLILSAREPVSSTDRRQTPGLLWLQNGLAWLVSGNDLYDTATGKKMGDLNVSNALNEQLVGADSILILQKNSDGPSRAILARFDDDKIRQAAEKLQQ